MGKYLVTVTGATGRLGVPIVKALEKKYSLRLLCRDASKAKRLFPGKKIIEIDLEIAGVAEIQNAVSGSWAVVNLAGLVDLCASREKLFSINYQATQKVVIACEREKVPFFIHCSSISVYADSTDVISENNLRKPTTIYGQSKLAAEKAVSNSKLQWVMLRPGIIYGPHFKEGFVDLLNQMQRGSAAVIGSGNNKVPLVYEDDVAKAFAKTLELLRSGNKKILHNAFNVVGVHPAQIEAYTQLSKSFGFSVPKRHVPLKLAVAIAKTASLYCSVVGKKNNFPPEYVELLARHRVYETEKTKRMLGGFTASTSLENGMRKTRKAWKV